MFIWKNFNNSGLLINTKIFYQLIFVLLIILEFSAHLLYAEDRATNTKLYNNKIDTYDIAIFAATPAGIMAAVSARSQNQSVVLVNQNSHIGGIISSGLGGTDHCDKRVIGGLSKQFFYRNGKFYNKKATWRLEPHKAEQLFEAYIKDSGTTLLRNETINSLELMNQTDGKIISSIKLNSGRIIKAKVYIDASYEGDLLAQAKVSYTIGREARGTYNEPLAGVYKVETRHQFSIPVPAYDSNLELFSGISAEKLAEEGSSDRKIMAYNYRVCLTKETNNLVPIEKPENYQAKEYKLLGQYLGIRKHTLIKDIFGFLDIPNKKYDLNNRGPFSTDLLGQNWSYPEASEEERQKIRLAHENYTKGLLYYLTSDPEVPDNIKKSMQTVGYCKDEFSDNKNWPYELYIREARRLVGEYVLNQNDMSMEAVKPDPIALASCPIESHHVQRLTIATNSKKSKDSAKTSIVKNEGWVSGYVTPYQIPYRSITPKQKECGNLLVPVALSASHIANSSLRMEPTYMILGQSAGLAASLAAKQNLAVQQIRYAELKKLLLSQRQKIEVKKNWFPKNRVEKGVKKH